MNTKKGFELNKKGVRDLLRSEEMLSFLMDCANEVQLNAGDGYTINSMVGKNRVNVEIVAATKKAKKDNLSNNTLLKALGSVKK